MPKSSFLIGYDFGTSSVKAILLDALGTALATAHAAYPLHLPGPGMAEQTPEDWWRAMCVVTRKLLADSNVAPSAVCGIGVGAQMCGVIPVDADGAALHPCLLWMDTRSQGIAREITAGGPRVAGYGALRLAEWLWKTNGAPNLSGKDPLTKILWLQRHQPEVAARTTHWLDVKDWLLLRCTGRRVTTPDCAQLTWLFNNRAGRQGWDARLLTRHGLPEAQLPSVVHATDAIGNLTPAAAGELGLTPQTLVSGGVGDLNACALAAGKLSEGAYHLHLGTSMWVGAHSEKRRVDPFAGIATICAAEANRYFFIATQESAGAAAEWAARNLGFGEGGSGLAELDAAAARCAPSAQQHAPLFLPWLIGERVPVDDPTLRGGLVGLSLHTQRDAIAFAVLEGIAHNTRWALDTAGKTLKADDSPIIAMGGGAASRHWLQIFANVLQRPVLPLQNPRFGGALGAAMTAAVASGILPSLQEAAQWAILESPVTPQPETAHSATLRHQRYLDFWRSTRGWHQRSLRSGS